MLQGPEVQGKIRISKTNESFTPKLDQNSS